MDDPIRFACSCGKQIKAPPGAAGRTAKCPACGKPVTVPGAASKPELLPATSPLAGSMVIRETVREVVAMPTGGAAPIVTTAAVVPSLFYPETYTRKEWITVAGAGTTAFGTALCLINAGTLALSVLGAGLLVLVPMTSKYWGPSVRSVGAYMAERSRETAALRLERERHVAAVRLAEAEWKANNPGVPAAAMPPQPVVVNVLQTTSVTASATATARSGSGGCCGCLLLLFVAFGLLMFIGAVGTAMTGSAAKKPEQQKAGTQGVQTLRPKR